MTVMRSGIKKKMYSGRNDMKAKMGMKMKKNEKQSVLMIHTV